MTPHRPFAMHEASQVGEARRFAARLAEEAGFDDVAAGRLALVVNELGHNLVRHAQEGRLLLGVRSAGEGGLAAVEVIALDHGPGIADLARCYADGYSTGGTPGTGLGAVRRLSQRFDAYSRLGVGTVMVARVAAVSTSTAPHVPDAPDVKDAHHGLELACVALPAPGEWVSGDAWAVQGADDHCRVLVADGLGHGPDAALAADQAADLFQRFGAQSLPSLIDAMHERLRGTRGAAVAVLQAQADGQLALAGAGNVLCRVISGTEDRTLVTPHGTLGLQVRRSQALLADWPEHALLVMHSDGIASRWSLADAPGLIQRWTAVIAAWILHHHLRGRDDATVVVMRRHLA